MQLYIDYIAVIQMGTAMSPEGPPNCAPAQPRRVQPSIIKDGISPDSAGRAKTQTHSVLLGLSQS